MKRIIEAYKIEANRIVFSYVGILFTILSCLMPFYALHDGEKAYYISYLSYDGFAMLILMGLLMLFVILNKPRVQCIFAILAIILYIYDVVLLMEPMKQGLVSIEYGVIAVFFGLVLVSLMVLPNLKKFINR